MKIGQTQDTTPIDPLLRNDARAKGGSATGSTSATGDSDSVKLSAASKSLNSSSAAGSPERVAAIKNAVDSGKYQIDVQAIAQKMISESASLVETLGGGG